MARKSNKTKSKVKQFAMIRHDVAKHLNFHSLSLYSKLLYVYFELSYNGYNNGDLAATYKMAKSMGFTRSSATLSKSLKELEDKGFLIKTRQGGKNKCNLFALTTHAIDDSQGKHDFQPTIKACNSWKINN